MVDTREFDHVSAALATFSRSVLCGSSHCRLHRTQEWHCGDADGHCIRALSAIVGRERSIFTVRHKFPPPPEQLHPAYKLRPLLLQHLSANLLYTNLNCTRIIFIKPPV